MRSASPSLSYTSAHVPTLTQSQSSWGTLTYWHTFSLLVVVVVVVVVSGMQCRPGRNMPPGDCKHRESCLQWQVLMTRPELLFAVPCGRAHQQAFLFSEWWCMKCIFLPLIFSPFTFLVLPVWWRSWPFPNTLPFLPVLVDVLKKGWTSPSLKGVNRQQTLKMAIYFYTFPYQA